MTLASSQDVVRKRFELLVNARLRKKQNIYEAITIQDSIRNKLKGQNLSRKIREWRDMR